MFHKEAFLHFMILACFVLNQLSRPVDSRLELKSLNYKNKLIQQIYIRLNVV